MKRSGTLAAAFIAALLNACDVFGGAEVAPGATWTLKAVDDEGPLGTITVERGDVLALPAEVVAMDPVRTHALFVHVTYELDRADADGHGAHEWRYTSEVVAPIAIFEEPPSGQHELVPDAPGAPLRALAPGAEGSASGWLMLTVPRAHLDARITLTYLPSGESLVVHAP